MSFHNFSDKIQKEFEKLYQKLQNSNTIPLKTSQSKRKNENFQDFSQEFLFKKPKSELEIKRDCISYNGAKNILFSPKDILNKQKNFNEKESVNIKPIDKNINEILEMMNQVKEELGVNNPNIDVKHPEERILVLNTQPKQINDIDEDIIIESSQSIINSDLDSMENIKSNNSHQIPIEKKDILNMDEIEIKNKEIKEDLNEKDFINNIEPESGIIDLHRIIENPKFIEKNEERKNENSIKDGIEETLKIDKNNIKFITDPNLSVENVKELKFLPEENLEETELNKSLDIIEKYNNQVNNDEFSSQDTLVLEDLSQPKPIESPILETRLSHDTQKIDSDNEIDTNINNNFVYLTPENNDNEDGIIEISKIQEIIKSQEFQKNKVKRRKSKDILNGFHIENQFETDLFENFLFKVVESKKATKTNLLFFNPNKKLFNRKPKEISLAFIFKISKLKSKKSYKIESKPFLKRNIKKVKI